MASSKRELISPRGDKRFVRRDSKGRITESDDVGRSLTQDRRRAAKATAKPGQGDKGDRKDATSAARKSAGTKASTGRSAATKSSSKAASKKSAPRKVAASKTAPAKKTTSKSATKSPTKKASVRKGASTRPPSRAGAPNAIQLLKADHATVRALLTQLEETTARGTKTRQELLARIRREIDVHATIEEEIFYPAFKAAGKRGDDEKMYFEALEEHRAAGDLVLPDLLDTDPASECFSGRAKVLKELIEHHAKEEEKEMFPRARELLSDAELKQLGERMAARKAELLAQPAPPKSMAGRLLSAVVGAIAQPGIDEASDASRSRGAKANRNGAAPVVER